VHPSLVEGWTSPPLEAMASGTPVVASRASSIPETVGDAARLFDPLEPEELAEVLSAVLDQQDVRQNLIRQGLERAARFTWERNARLTLDAYREVLK
jgi:alpha-1,3-rhamnosyl/mannosyltransferase